MLADRGFYSWQDWCAADDSGAALLWRVKSDLRLPVVAELGDHSYLSVVISPDVRGRARTTLVDAARERRLLDPAKARYVRVVEYDVTDREGNSQHELFALITNIVDPWEAPAIPLAGVYQQRWEHKTGNSQLKTHLRGPGKVLRSRLPELVYQEIWGYLLAHFALSALICAAATAAGIDPDGVRFTRTLRTARRRVGDPPACCPEHQQQILDRVHADITRPGKINTRRQRSYPRVVRRARHNQHPVKKPGQRGVRYDSPPTISLARLPEPAPATETTDHQTSRSANPQAA